MGDASGKTVIEALPFVGLNWGGPTEETKEKKAPVFFCRASYEKREDGDQKHLVITASHGV